MRTFLVALALFLLTPSNPVQAAIPVFSLGLLADIQYCDADPQIGAGIHRYPRNSITKLNRAIAAFNQKDLKYAVILGDYVDVGRESYAKVDEAMKALKSPVLRVLGNHDFYQRVDTQFHPEEKLSREETFAIESKRSRLLRRCSRQRLALDRSGWHGHQYFWKSRRQRKLQTRGDSLSRTQSRNTRST